ncbi:MAG TPA: NHL repeat-containing protein [Candidatus Krumholzibacteria bacterium]|nr:NHL repeat-containing protein [Candidatus Krumholzibacteria bacterium]HRX50663.1 NHL repeat-containing protein [Candidatus Krumholzibacteria bacterium]
MRRLAALLILGAALLLAACAAKAPAPERAYADLPRAAYDESGGGERRPDPDRRRPAELQFLTAYENETSAPYYPLEGLAGVAYARDGSLYVCDELGGRVHVWSPAEGAWFQLDSPGSRFYRPVDVHLDGFQAWVLDMDGRELLRFGPGGSFLDRLVDFRYLNPGYDHVPVAFDVDVDGSVVVVDPSESMALLLDSFLGLRFTVGRPGPHREQFDAPSGVAFLSDGGFVVSDRGNRRLQRFNRLGTYDGEAGGADAVGNPLLTPQGVERDVWDNLFVADPAAAAVHVYDADLRHLFSLGADAGLREGPETPIDVAVGPDDLLAVSDRGRGAVLIYRILYQ